MAEKYSKLKVKELQGKSSKPKTHFNLVSIYLPPTFLPAHASELLQKHGLPHSGKKDELIERLVKHDEKKMDDFALEEELGNLEEFDEAKLEYVFGMSIFLTWKDLGATCALRCWQVNAMKSTWREGDRDYAKEYSILTVPAFH